MKDFTFTPQTVKIQVGDTVTWVNQQGSHDVQSSITLFKSPPPPVQQFSFTFTSPGTVNYHCNPHQSFGMTGSVVVQAPANQPPTVRLASPASGAFFAAPATLLLQAQAADADGTVASVQFFNGRTSLGVATNAPYQVSANLPAGTYNFTAVATDNKGAATTSGPVTNVVVYTPFKITRTSRAENGDVILELAGDFSTGQATIQKSSDLGIWTDLAATGFGKDPAGQTIYTDHAGAADARYYRLRFQFGAPAAP